MPVYCTPYLYHMYNVPDFKDNNPATLINFMRHHPFALLCAALANGVPQATHLPLLVSLQNDNILLRGHMMKNTSHHLAWQQNPQALAVFSGPHCYVSASWYGNPRKASTWNYMAVHASGSLRFTDHDTLIDILRETTDLFEQPGSPSAFDQLPSEYVNRLSSAIIGFEMEVTSLEHVFKLSQNHNETDYHSIINHLQATDDQGSRQIAAQMQQRAPQLFKK